MTRNTVRTPTGVSTGVLDAYAAATDAASAAVNMLRARGHAVTESDGIDAAHDVVTDALETGVTLDVQSVAKLVTSKLTANVRNVEKVTRVLRADNARRYDQRNTSSVRTMLEEPDALTDAAACRIAETLSRGTYDPTDARSVEHARAVLVAWAGVNGRTVRDRGNQYASPVTLADIERYARRVANHARANGATFGAACALLDTYATEYARSLTLTAEFAWSEHAAHVENAAHVRARTRAVLAGINATLDALDAPTRNVEHVEPTTERHGRRKSVETRRGVSGLALTPTGPVATLVTVRNVPTEAGAWEPTDIGPRIRHRESGAGISTDTLDVSHGPDTARVRRTYKDTLTGVLRGTVGRRTPTGARKRGRPALDVLDVLDTYAAGVSVALSTFTGARITLDTLDVLGVSNADADTHPFTYGRRDKYGRTIGRDTFNMTCLSDVLADVGVKASADTLTRQLRAWAERVETGARYGRTPRRIDHDTRAWSHLRNVSHAYRTGVLDVRRVWHVSYAPSLSHVPVYAALDASALTPTPVVLEPRSRVGALRAQYGACRACGYVEHACRCEPDTLTRTPDALREHDTPARVTYRGALRADTLAWVNGRTVS